VEFDYCCCQAAYALSDLGFETIMLNCNPETVSTDYDTADRLYFEPLTLEHVLNVVEVEQPEGVIVQFGGQTPLNLAAGLQAAGVPILGTSPQSIWLAEDRERFAALLAELDIPQPHNAIARSQEEAAAAAAQIGYPVLVRPSFVLGGRAMAVVSDESQLAGFVEQAFAASPGQPLLVDQFMEDAYEIDVDALCDGQRVVIGAIMQHIEEAGVHSGDSACVLPPYKVSAYHLDFIRDYSERLGLALGVRGLMNVQFAIKDDIVYRAGGQPARQPHRALRQQGHRPAAGPHRRAGDGRQEPGRAGRAGRAAGRWFLRQGGGAALQEAARQRRSAGAGDAQHRRGDGPRQPLRPCLRQGAAGGRNAAAAEGRGLLSVNDFDKGAALKIARDLHRLGFHILATPGTADALRRASIPVQTVNKVSQGSPHVVDADPRRPGGSDPQHPAGPARSDRWPADPSGGHGHGRAAADHPVSRGRGRGSHSRPARKGFPLSQHAGALWPAHARRGEPALEQTFQVAAKKTPRRDPGGAFGCYATTATERAPPCPCPA
jgi:carbamoyl-phosphate synthase large subunit